MKVISVGQLNRYVKSVLENDGNLAAVYIGGEISNFTHHYKSGHLYLTLKDDTAAVKAVMFKGHASKLAFRPEDGMRVIVRARVSLYEATGSFQIYIEEMQPDGVGALQVAYEQLKKKLAAEGLFDESRKRPLPPYPTRVGVITSPTGAAVRDILNVLGRRYPLAQVVFCPVLVQGDGAAPSIVDAIQRFNAAKAADVLIVGRGGGSIEDLWAFNEEIVARAVAASAIPVISAVGHETDFTICDFVADLRAPTPSAAAELVISHHEELFNRLNRAERGVQQSLSLRLARLRTRIDNSVFRLNRNNPERKVLMRKQRIDELEIRCSRVMESRLAAVRTRLAYLCATLSARNPDNLLELGYAFVIDPETGKPVTTSQIAPDTQLHLRFADGVLPVKTLDKSGQTEK